MDVWDELLSKFSKMAGKPDSEDQCGLSRFGEARAIKIERYYADWRKRVESAARTRQIMSNGWAFAALGGVAAFENYVRTAEVSAIYKNRTAEVASTLDAIIEKLPTRGRRAIGGIVIYGYGNLFRESHFVEVAVSQKLLQAQRVYLLDCSLFYHVLAKSSLNPLRSILNERQIKVKLLDYFEDSSAKAALTFIRDDLNPFQPVIHLFLGNTFCNVDSVALKTLLSSVVRDNDFVVGEYANYMDAYFEDLSDDYVSHMASVSASELFSVPIASVTSKNVAVAGRAKAVEVIAHCESSVPKLAFRSMLRRSFNHAELTDGPYELISQETSMHGKVSVDAYRRLPNAREDA